MTNFRSLVQVCAVSIFSVGGVYASPPDSVSDTRYRNSVSIQTGQFTELRRAEYELENRPGFPLAANETGLRFSFGATYRHYLDESFFLHVRGSYSLYSGDYTDSATFAPVTIASGNELHTYNESYHSEWNYRRNALLIGIGGGHEITVKRFRVRAGAELQYIRYMTNTSAVFSGGVRIHQIDTMSTGGSYEQRESWSDEREYTYVNFQGFGLMGHASLEYAINDHWAVGAALYMGINYTFVSDQANSTYISSSSHITDTNGVDQLTSAESVREENYSLRYFDISPLNGQINVLYYFGK